MVESTEEIAYGVGCSEAFSCRIKEFSLKRTCRNHLVHLFPLMFPVFMKCKWLYRYEMVSCT